MTAGTRLVSMVKRPIPTPWCLMLSMMARVLVVKTSGT